MVERVGFAAAGLAVATLISASAASAERPPYGPPEGTPGPPDADCPSEAGWTLVTPSGPEHLSAAYDFNGDGQVCVRLVPGGGIAFMDDVVR